ncbi:MAG: UvrB/UvrC motif-containing protein [Planctomycetes bacterium]|nr:UvrB/UvrC motif-containing protein [Planctomycetota bacterium]
MSNMCHICLKNPATSHLSEMTDNDGLIELHICSSCCTSLQLDLPSNPLPITSILQKASAADQDGPSDTPVTNSIDVDMGIDVKSPNANKTCPQCGISFEQFSANNRFGCAHDYDAFSDELLELLTDLHGNLQHIGRAPHQDINRDNRVANLIRLEKNLKESIAEERFEEAARIRDQIKELDE